MKDFFNDLWLVNKTDDIRAVLGDHDSSGEDLGFGAQRFHIGKGSGYTSFYVDVFTFEGAIQRYEVGIEGHSDHWPRIKDDIAAAWRKSGAPVFEETQFGLVYRKTLDPEFQAYKNTVAAKLGKMKAVKVPADLNGYYEFLISPMNNSTVGFWVCGFAPRVVEGKVAIDALVKANRVDLIENILRGYNPGGRVYAAAALLDMKEHGLPLSRATQITISEVSNLKIPITTCGGCIVSHQAAKAILEGRKDTQ